MNVAVDVGAAALKASGSSASSASSSASSGGKNSSRFNPAESTFFEPDKSVSFLGQVAPSFSMVFADGARLSGFVSKDIVELGGYFVPTRFGCIAHCEDPHFNGVDGILGLGLPGAASPEVPHPLFVVLSSQFGADGANARHIKVPKFTIVSDELKAELQLGGTETASLLTNMVHIECTSEVEYSVPVESLKLGGIELLQWKRTDTINSLPAILDSGTSCLVLPDSSVNGALHGSPFKMFESIKDKEGLSFYITIRGYLFEIPFSSWWRSLTNQGCVQAAPSDYHGVLLGDVLFRSLVVEFDLTHPKHPRVGLAPRNPLYEVALPGRVTS